MIEQKAEIRKQSSEFKFRTSGIGHIFFISLCLVSLVILLPSCKDKVENITIDYEYDYYPLDSGRYIIYDVDSIRFSWQPTTGSGYIQYTDTIRYQLKEFYAGAFYDSFQGNLKYRIEYYRRNSTDDPWQNDRVWYAIKTATNLQRQEDDLRFMKLVFPPREGYSWDGTVFITKTGLFEFLQNWKFQYVNVGKPFSVNGIDFEKTLTVNHILPDEDNRIDYQYSREIFAKGVGIIYRDWDKITKQNVLSGWGNPQQATGHRIKMRINSYSP